MQGAHLLNLRRQAGVTQVELAKALGVSQASVGYWEWSDKPPPSKELPALAQVLGVSIDQLIAGTNEEDEAGANPRRAPVGELQKLFERVRRRPRSQQRKIIELLTAILDQYERRSA